MCRQEWVKELCPREILDPADPSGSTQTLCPNPTDEPSTHPQTLGEDGNLRPLTNIPIALCDDAIARGRTPCTGDNVRKVFIVDTIPSAACRECKSIDNLPGDERQAAILTRFQKMIVEWEEIKMNRRRKRRIRRWIHGEPVGEAGVDENSSSSSSSMD